MIFSKFRGLKVDESGNLAVSDNSHFFDILQSKELYANKFNKFNDMLDCSFHFDKPKSKDKVKELLKKIYTLKLQKNICCFSKEFVGNNPKEHLMWAHYANNHYGVRIDFELESNIKAIEVKYSKCVYLNNIEQYLNDIENFSISEKDMKTIMTCKGSIWKYEQEYRVISENIKIPIKIKKITIGRAFSDNIDDNSPKIFKVIDEIKEKLNDSNVDIYYYKNRYSKQKTKFKE